MLDARYLDGRSARDRPCRIRIEAGELRVTDTDGNPIARAPTRGLRIGAPGRSPSRRIALADGAALDVPNTPAFDAMLAAAGIKPRPIERVESSWRHAIVGVLVLVAIAYGAWRYGVPAAADAIASRVPASWEARLGEAAAGMIDSAPFKPSQLDAARREAIETKFRAMVAAHARAHPSASPPPPYRLQFRRFGQGPNAFALPGGTIVMTDELVAIATDEAILGVLAHELGHLRHRHSLKGLIEASLISSLVGVMLGDFSTILATVPATLLQLSYSRAHEQQADDEAIAMLASAGLSTEPLAALFEQLEAKRGGSDGPWLLSSHPGTKERIARLRGR